MGKCPVGFAAVVRFDDCSQADFQLITHRQEFVGEDGIQFKAIGKAANAGLWWHGRQNSSIRLAVSRKAIGCPLAGGREIEFTIRCCSGAGNEGFAAGLLP